MGKSTTPRYYAIARHQEGALELAWNGRATNARAEEKRKGYNKSFQPGGCNEHVRLSNGGIPHIHTFQIVRNVRGGSVVAEARMPMFEAC